MIFLNFVLSRRINFSKARYLFSSIILILILPCIISVVNAEQKSGEEWTDPVTGMKFVWIPGGSFQMGDLFAEGDIDENHIRTISLESFWMGRYEVTQGEWKVIMGNNPSKFNYGDSYPVEKISWFDAQEFIQKLNELHNGSYIFRLPTEAEWEYAAREGGKKVRFGNGSNTADPNEINFDGSQDHKKPFSISGIRRETTTPVGSFPPNRLGLYDMSGNVYEWIEDIYTPDYRKVGTENPVYNGDGKYCVLRSGSWESKPEKIRCANRNAESPTNRCDCSTIGFRLVRTPDF